MVTKNAHEAAEPKPQAPVNADPLGPQTYTAAHLDQDIVIGHVTPGPVTVRLSYLEPEIGIGKHEVDTKVIEAPAAKTVKKPPTVAETG